jgi:phosphoglycolate phosphatase
VNAIIFDFDGTIADSFDVVLDFLVRRAGNDPALLTPDQRAALRGLSMKDLATKVGIPKWRLVGTYFAGRRHFLKHLTRVPPVIGIPELLGTLHGEQYKLLIISSNSRRNINRFLVERGLSSYFIDVYGSAGWFGKDNALKKVAERYNLELAKTVYVGDEERDISAAHKAGMASVAVNWGFASEERLLAQNPTFLVRSAAELEKTLVGLGRAT